MNPIYDDGTVSIYCGDSRDIVPFLPKSDLLVTDPPYGIDYDPSYMFRVQKSVISGDSDLTMVEWLFGSLDAMADNAVVFGANCFPCLLPHRGRWICWDKRVLHGGVVNADGGKRLHPTQKPIALWAKVFDHFPGCKTVIDPFCGVGSSLVAAKQLGIRAIGIEIDQGYCQKAIDRVRQNMLNFE